MFRLRNDTRNIAIHIFVSYLYSNITTFYDDNLMVLKWYYMLYLTQEVIIL